METYKVTIAGSQYTVDREWARLPRGYAFEAVVGVASDSQDRVYVLQRTQPAVLVFEPDGTFVQAISTPEFCEGHGINVARGKGDELLISDRDAHQILVMSSDGEVIRALGDRHSPTFQGAFNHPTAADVASNGDIFVSDGYANFRVHRFGWEGAHMASFGSPGTGPTEFMTPHSVHVDSKDRVLVADRENNRVPVFTADGELAFTLDHLFHPMDVCEDPDGLIHVTDQVPALCTYDASGTLLSRSRPVPDGAHGVCADTQGSLYLSEGGSHDRVTKLVKN